jgi:uncharacterized protein YqjF (DUF2071 family)
MLNGRAIMRMRWRHLLFAHWPVDVEALRPLVPPALEIDTFDGSAWVGLVPFTMEDVSPVLLPRAPRAAQGVWSALCGGAIAFHECNVRTYVYPRGRESDPAARGVWFFSLDATSRLAVWGARTFWKLPYFNARIHLRCDGDVIDYGVQRHSLSPWERAGVRAAASSMGASTLGDSHTPSPQLSPRRRGSSPSLRIRWRALEPMPPSQPGDLAHFLTERYCLYALRQTDAANANAPLAAHCGRIMHQPWPLRRAELISLDDSLVRAAGIEIDQSSAPLLYHADTLDVRACRLHCVR